MVHVPQSYSAVTIVRTHREAPVQERAVYSGLRRIGDSVLISKQADLSQVEGHSQKEKSRRGKLSPMRDRES